MSCIDVIMVGFIWQRGKINGGNGELMFAHCLIKH